jgi:hypothetical protein
MSHVELNFAPKQDMTSTNHALDGLFVKHISRISPSSGRDRGAITPRQGLQLRECPEAKVSFCLFQGKMNTPRDREELSERGDFR